MATIFGVEGLLVVLVLVGLYLWAVHAVARTAERKGRSYFAFSAIGFFISPVLAWIIVSSLAPSLPRVGDAVETVQRIELADGTNLPRKFVTKVLDTDVMEQTPVIQIDAEGRPAWIARSAVRKL